MNMAVSRAAISRLGTAPPRARSSLVRRLVAAGDDPGKQRIRSSLAALGDEALSRLGLTPQDIAILRGKPKRDDAAAQQRSHLRPPGAGRLSPGYRSPLPAAPHRRGSVPAGQLQKL
jgi:hypothetical protein